MELGAYKKMVCLIGGIIAFGNAFELSIGYILLPKDPFAITMSDLFIRNFLGALSVFPKGLPLLIALFGNDQLLSLITVWQIATFLCGVGILAFRNFARVIVIAICTTAIVISFLAHMVFFLLPKPPSPALTSPSFVLTLISGLGWILPFVYIFILTRRDVKGLFKY